MALLFMDLDGFKKVNDTLGLDVGDKLLAEVAHRFSTVVRVSDHLGRVISMSWPKVWRPRDRPSS